MKAVAPSLFPRCHRRLNAAKISKITYRNNVADFFSLQKLYSVIKL